MFQNLGIIIVLYKPKIEKINDNFRKYYGTKLNVVFVVNATTNVFRNQLLNEIKEYKNVYSIFLEDNVGIAGAQNRGILYLLGKDSIDNVLFLDQDSYMDVSEIRKLQMVLTSQNLKTPALVAPKVYGLSNKGLHEVSETISSGSLIPASVLKNVGMFRAEYFIDFVDYEWCWRAINNGYYIYIDDDIKIIHQTENDVRRRLGHTMESPFRLYYVYRNLLWSLRDTDMGLRFNTKWLIRYFVKALFQIIIADNRIERLKKISGGIIDGMTKHQNQKM